MIVHALATYMTQEDKERITKIAGELGCYPPCGTNIYNGKPSIQTLIRRIALKEILVRRVGKFPARPNGVEKLGQLRHEQFLQRLREAEEKARAEAEGQPSDPKEKSVLDQTLES